MAASDFENYANNVASMLGNETSNLRDVVALLRAAVDGAEDG